MMGTGSVAVIGAGPAGLMAAEVLSGAGVAVVLGPGGVFDEGGEVVDALFEVLDAVGEFVAGGGFGVGDAEPGGEAVQAGHATRSPLTNT
jgi:NADPH-dependent 2,4-dienoyl-CoA reductase/sulfur reductase-like enzyme